jgi:hypothetical protein
MKIHFKYSEVYDQLLTESSFGKYSKEQKDFVLKFVDKLEKEWRREENQIIKKIEKISNLKFKYKKIPCFIVKNIIYEAISYPLTIKVSDVKNVKDVLIHELIHVNLKDSKNLLRILNKFILNSEFKIHLPVLLIQKKVMDELYGNKRFLSFLKRDANDGLMDVWDEIKVHHKNFKKDIVGYLDSLV